MTIGQKIKNTIEYWDWRLIRNKTGAKEGEK